VTPSAFRQQWGATEELVRFSPHSLDDIRIPEEARVFLLEAGLPKDAAPFLSFSAPKSGSIPSAAQTYRLSVEFSRYKIIGSTGWGDPVCLDTGANGLVVHLDHEARFRPVFINGSVPQLAAFLLSYRRIIEATNASNGEWAFLDGNIPADLRQSLEDDLRKIDAEALREGTFWRADLQNMDANMKAYSSRA
jgi:hypothetical protein